MAISIKEKGNNIKVNCGFFTPAEVPSGGGGKLYKHTTTFSLGSVGPTSFLAKIVEYKTNNIAETKDLFVEKLKIKLTEKQFSSNTVVFEPQEAFSTPIKLTNNYYGEPSLDTSFFLFNEDNITKQSIFDYSEISLNDINTIDLIVNDFNVKVEEV